MIHVCRVDIGSRYVFDMAQGIDDVASLKKTIEKYCSINTTDQVLLIGGGIVLNNSKQKLFGLSAGIEESPIYLIDARTVRQPQPPSLDVANFEPSDLIREIDEAISWRASFATLQRRTELAARLLTHAQQLHKFCECYYHDQFWQYQGFLALIANLDELVESFNKLADSTKRQFDAYAAEKGRYSDTLGQMKHHVDTLARTRLLPQVLQSGATFSAKLFMSQSTSVSGAQSPPPPNESTSAEMKSLLDWANSTDARYRLETVVVKARECIEHLDTDWWSGIDAYVEKIRAEADNRPMKEIDGLTRRFSGLQSLLDAAKGHVTRQSEVAEGFRTNLSRATTLRDETILVDLCRGHERQLEVLRESHVQLIEITKKMCKAKVELVRVVHPRLAWVMSVEQRMIGECQARLLLYSEQMKQSLRYMRQFEQLKVAPEVYLMCLHETLRRRRFSEVYKKFGAELHKLALRVFKNEKERREAFRGKYCRSFVANLFPYLSDGVVAIVRPELEMGFDADLPVLGDADVRAVEAELGVEVDKVSCDEDLCVMETATRRLVSGLARFDEELKVQMMLIDDAKGKESSGNDAPDAHADGSDDDVVEIDEMETMKAPSEQLVLVSKRPVANEEFLAKLGGHVLGRLGETKELIKSSKSEISETLAAFKGQLDALKATMSAGAELHAKKKEAFYNYVIESLFVSDQSAVDASHSADEVDEAFYAKMKENLLKLRETYEKKIDEMRRQNETIKQNFIAEKQKMFNEAIERVSSEKEKKIKELELSNANLLKQLESLSGTGTSPSPKNEAFLSKRVADLEKQLGEMQRYQAPPPPAPFNSLAFNLNPADVSLNESHTTLVSSASMSTLANVTSDCRLRAGEAGCVSLHTCAPNDLVLVVYDDEHLSYRVVNQSSTYTHFVHTDSLKYFEAYLSGSSVEKNLMGSPSSSPSSMPSPPMDVFENFYRLNVNAAASSHAVAPHAALHELIGLATPAPQYLHAKPMWFVGKVLLKEFCIAKKENNRYRIAAGTRFYRVKVKPFKL